MAGVSFATFARGGRGGRGALRGWSRFSQIVTTRFPRLVTASIAPLVRAAGLALPAIVVGAGRLRGARCTVASATGSPAALAAAFATSFTATLVAAIASFTAALVARMAAVAARFTTAAPIARPIRRRGRDDGFGRNRRRRRCSRQIVDRARAEPSEHPRQP